ncbi:MAG TPA: DUF302 domain-containing protein, partial [Pirellulales bacterium]|nr:DUF302 domain-containing protein [Pirellulales bacterium]
MITYRSRKSVDELTKALEKAVAEHGFGVLGVHDLQAKLAAKQVPLNHVCKVFEVCNPQQAKVVLDRDLSISTALPCRIAMYEAGDELELATIEPTELLAMFLKEAEACGMSGLPGYRKYGGIRASIYSAMPLEGA